MSVEEIITKLDQIDLTHPDLQLELSIELGKKVNNDNRDQIIDALARLLNYKKYPACTRAHAVEELGKIRGDKAKELLRSALNDPYRLVRSYAVRALGDYNDKDLIEDLKKVGLSDNEFFGVMAEAAEALKKICLDVLGRYHDDPICQEVMEKTIPEIKQKADKKKKEDARYEKRVSREAEDAKIQFNIMLKDFNKQMDLLMEKKNFLNVKEEAERIRKDEGAKKEFNEQSDKFKRNLPALGVIIAMISEVGLIAGH
jgi:hypothetical protein